jgi:hypothetical protein
MKLSHYIIRLFVTNIEVKGMEYIYFLLTIAIKNSTRIDRPMKGMTISVNVFSSDILCSKNS